MVNDGLRQVSEAHEDHEDHEDPLVRAIELSREFKARPGNPDAEAFLCEHASLRDILEPMLLPAQDDVGPEVIGEYELVRELGQGGMGVVYEAVQPLIGRTVALKLLPPHRALSPRSMALFRREATLAASLDHPGIARVFSLEEVDGQLALAMELIDGVSLDNVLHELRSRVPQNLTGADIARALQDAHADPFDRAYDGDPSLATEPARNRVEAAPRLPETETTPAEPVPPQGLPRTPRSGSRGTSSHRFSSAHGSRRRGDSKSSEVASRTRRPVTGSGETRHLFSRSHVEVAVDIARQVAEALSHAHARGVVHRDVKPGNIMLTAAGDAVLTDFGLAREEGFDMGTTRTGEFAGTYRYAAPEQLAGRLDEIDGRTDVYALGVTLYELLTLRRPFDADSLIEFSAKIEVEEPERPSRLNPRVGRDLEAVVLCALEKRREQRYANAHEMAVDLGHVLAGEPVRARRISTIGRVARWIGRNRLPSTVVVVLLVSTVLVSLFAARAFASNRRYESLWTGAYLAAIERRAAAAQPPWPEQRAELAALVHLAEAEILPVRALQEQALAELRRGHMRDAPAPRDVTRMPHPATQRIVELSGELHKLRTELGIDWDAQIGSGLGPRAVAAARAGAEAHIREITAEIAQLEQLVATSNRVQIEDREDRVLHDRIEEQLFMLKAFERTLLADLRFRLAWADSVVQKSITDHAGPWQAARERLARDPRFAGVELQPQYGLVPLGRDPKSQLEEFAHLLSGAVPIRGANGALDFGKSEVAHGDVDHGIVFVLVPGAKGFEAVVGVDRQREVVTRRVDLDPFFVAKHELNRAQWGRLARDLAGLGLRDGGILDVRNLAELQKPMNGVSWHASHRLLERYGLDLPTVAQWEYVARLGGDPPEDVAELARIANLYHFPDAYGGTAPVTAMQPDASGFHHLFGNVKEWCRDVHLEGETRLRPGDGMRVSPAWPDALRAICGPGFLTQKRKGAPPYNLLDRAAPDDRSRDTGLRPVRKLFATGGGSQ